MSRFLRSRVALVIVAAIVGASVSGVAISAAQEEEPEIHACVVWGVMFNVNDPAQCGQWKSLSWNHTGPEGPQGEPGASSPITQVLTKRNTVRAEISTDGIWQPLPGAELVVDVSEVPSRLLVDFWASVACFGPSREKYARALIDGVQVATVPLAAIPPSSTAQSEIPVSLKTSREVASTGSHTVAIEARVDSGSNCVIIEDLWHLEVDVLSP